ncbi:MAG: hypothetical protein A2358_01085 [Candidatus Staskawiczbacteria bacterium RIFOXYB1_FULL_37_44]|uniref:Laccase domain-containing protein n=1 Tax=Candidatus Staskawiczbacteria bacterium RIFOXYB1_FULL_37_44 TaxID=1802223 RepID=A0A1G2IXG2_9BACT|nr:MAG: hypothetical protein A2358_01085 [Candidatus Staskawiczbacteria bacterium RIFOXYB1_FULL_37_44]
MKTIPRLRHKILGIEHGNFSPSLQSREQFLVQMEMAKGLLSKSITTIFAPSVGFTNKLAEFGQDDDVFTPWLVRTKNKADAGLTQKPGVAIAFCNADCPIICLWQDTKLAVLHGGYRCLIRENPAENGILETAMQKLDPAKTSAFIFGGIGPCCWVPENDKPEIQNPNLCRHPEFLTKSLSKTTRSPLGKNLVSVDLYKLSRLILLKEGFLAEKIGWNPTCTCCYSVQDNGEPAYWSHIRFLAEQKAEQKTIDGRNFTVAWLE